MAKIVKAAKTTRHAKTSQRDLNKTPRGKHSVPMPG